MRDRILSLIKHNGPLSVADFMNQAMFANTDSYYRAKNPVGKKGDFITSPEISQAFGETIAAYFLDQILSQTDVVSLVEMGAGKGTLFNDIYRSINKISQKLQLNPAINYAIIEISETLTKIQQDLLGNKVKWYKNFTDFTIKTSHKIYFVCNELFDCFATHQFIKTRLGWQERMIGLIENQLCFIAEEFNPLKNKIITEIFTRLHPQINLQENDIFEHSFAAINFTDQLCEKIKNDGQMALIIDYGYVDCPLKSSLQAVKNHQYSDVLQNIGQADLTSLVDFSALQKTAQKHNLHSSLINQGDFLISLGILERKKALKDVDTSDAIDRLINKNQMGEVFKFLLIWK